MHPVLADDLWLISQVWSLVDLEAVEFIRLNVFCQALINDLLICNSAVYSGGINPLPDHRQVNGLNAHDGYRIRISYGAPDAKRQRFLYYAIRTNPEILL
jgi:hypothetical protein